MKLNNLFSLMALIAMVLVSCGNVNKNTAAS